MSWSEIGALNADPTMVEAELAPLRADWVAASRATDYPTMAAIEAKADQIKREAKRAALRDAGALHRWSEPAASRSDAERQRAARLAGAYPPPRPRDRRGRFVATSSPGRAASRWERRVRWARRHWLVTTAALSALYWLVTAGVPQVPDAVWTALGWSLTAVLGLVMALGTLLGVAVTRRTRRERRCQALLDTARAQLTWSTAQELPHSVALWETIVSHREARP